SARPHCPTRTSGRTSRASSRNSSSKPPLSEQPAAPIETDALIIGAGPVGLFQAFQLGLLEIPCRIVDALPHAGGQCVELYGHKPIYDIPGTPATTGRGLADALLEQLAPFGVPMHLGEQVATLAREADGRWRAG